MQNRSNLIGTIQTKFANFVSRFAITIYDGLLDMICCGHLLNKHSYSMQSHISAIKPESCRYIILQKIFNDLCFSDKDKIIDVGCGPGRVLAYLNHKYSNINLTGVDIDANIIDFCQKWNKKNNINFITANAFDINLNYYNYLIIGHTFNSEEFSLFVDKIEQEIHHPITLICICDITYILPQSPQWVIEKQEQIYKHKSLTILSKINRYSILKFTPYYENNSSTI